MKYKHIMQLVLLLSITMILPPSSQADNISNINISEEIIVIQEQERSELNHWNFETLPAPVVKKSSRHTAVKKGKWQYKGDEAYQSFPNIYIAGSFNEKNRNIQKSASHRRRSLSSRSGSYHRRINGNITPSILKYAKQYDIDPHIIRAIIQIESSYNPKAYSCSGACGLMQLKPGTALEMGVANYWDPDQNIKAGTRYISIMLKKFKTLDLALAAYNQGPGTVQWAGNRIPNSTARHYIHKFYKAYYRT